MSVQTGTPLVVRCVVAAPVAGPHPFVHLDAVLAWAFVLLRGPSDRRGVGHTSTDRLPARRVSLPLRRVENMWACSCLWPVAPEPVSAQTRWRLRPAVEFGDLVAEKQIAFGHGPRRPHDEPLTLWLHREWQARCEGKPSEIRKLLRVVSAIGKKRSQGYGRVVSWEVSPDPLGAQWRDWGGLLRRPVAHPQGYATGIDPPQWYRPWWAPGFDPGTPTWSVP